VGVYELELIFM